MKKKKYLPLYYKWMESERLPHNGLCNCFGLCYSEDKWESGEGYEDFEIMFPLPYDDVNIECRNYWGAGEKVRNLHVAFTPLRQNIVLFLAAMNNEL
jgi:hypothetical protein